MAQYKDGNEKISQSGGGLEGFDRSNFHKYITRDVCKYYFILDSVLKDRPNVKAWFTNEDEWNDEDSDEDSNDEEMNHMAEEFNLDDDSSMESSNQLVVQEYESNLNLNTNMISTNIPNSHVSLLSDDNNSSSSTMRTSDDLSSLAGSLSKRKRRNMTVNKTKRPPLEAKIRQKKMTKKRNKTISKKKASISSSTFSTMDQDEQELTIETRDAKMSFEREKHKDLRSIESEKLMIEKERLQLEKDNMIMKKEQLMAQREQIMAQTNLEKSRIVLLKMDMFKSRQAIKKDYPDVTDEYLNEQFPYPE